MSTAPIAPDVSQPLDDWLRWLETIHPVAIDMGLGRVSMVADRLGLRPSASPLILVGGTNGKGSTATTLSQIYTAAGYRVGAYTSPHISSFCERIQINGAMVAEHAVVEALAFVEQGRAPDTLTYFEYTTLAAMRVFSTRQCDVVIFEVGLGGRLDATNIWDADCSVVTSVALDHEDYLGSELSVIATEKAAIGRPGKPFVVGEVDPPASLMAFAVNHDFAIIDVGSMSEDQLPHTAMLGSHQRRNAACAIAAVNSLQETLPVAQNCLNEALSSVSMPGRFQKLVVDGVPVVLDVAHNPAGALALADAWVEQFGSQKCEIVFATLADKDVAGVANALQPIVNCWHCLKLDTARAMSAGEIAVVVKQSTGNESVKEYARIDEAFGSALARAKSTGGAILVAGSFYTISAAQSMLASLQAVHP